MTGGLSGPRFLSVVIVPVVRIGLPVLSVRAVVPVVRMVLWFGRSTTVVLQPAISRITKTVPIASDVFILILHCGVADAKHCTENDCTQEDSTYSAGYALFHYGQSETTAWLDAAKSDAQSESGCDTTKKRRCDADRHGLFNSGYIRYLSPSDSLISSPRDHRTNPASHGREPDEI